MEITNTDPFWLWQLFGRLHPLIVHFPISLLCVALLLELLSSKKPSLRESTVILLWIGTVSAFLSVVFGVLLANHQEASGTQVELHRWSGIGTFILAALSLFGLHRKRFKFYRITLLVTVVGVIVAGHLGAMLTHGEEYLSSVFPSDDYSPSHAASMSTGLSLASLGETLNEQQVQDLTLEVRTIFAHNCNNCHGEAKKKGGLRLDSREAIFAGGESGPILVPGQSGKSELIRRVTLPAGHKDVMPSKGKLLNTQQIEVLKVWIDRGAPWPDGKLKSVYRVADLEPRLPELPAPVGDLTSPIDRLVDRYFKSKNITWPERVDDRTYIRRVYLDAIGLLPTPQEIEQFVNDSSPNKRSTLVKSVLSRDDDYAQHWLTFWNDLLRNDYSGTGYITGGRFDITKWLYASLYDNKPYNWFVKELISPTKESAGFIKGIKWRGTINSSQSTEMQAAQNVAQVFLGLNLKCASCHDSFISDWTLEQAYSFAGIFADSTLEIHRCDQPTGKIAQSRMLFPELGEITVDAPTADRLRELADFLAQPKDGRLYRTLVNRIWAQLMGRGLVEPVDMMDNLPWSQDLLDWLAYDFVENGYDIKRLMEQILVSKTYQLVSVAIQDPAELVSEDFVFRGMVRRRLSAEQFADAVSASFYPIYTDSAMAKKMLPADIMERAPFPRASLVINDRFMTALGRPNRETVSTSRMSQASLIQALELTNGTTFYDALKKGAEAWRRKYPDSGQLVDALFKNIFGRAPTQEELNVTQKVLGDHPDESSIQDLVWAMMLSPEFQLIF